jgi:3'(2'), 5'-bisphosphate nucleotidase
MSRPPVPLSAERLAASDAQLVPRVQAACSAADGAEELSTSALLNSCLRACGAVTPLTKAVYAMVGAEHGAPVPAGASTASKADGSLFTLADGLVQALLERLLRPLVVAIIAEEDSASLHIDAPPYAVCGLTVPAALEPLVTAAIQEVDAIATGFGPAAVPLNLIAVIDPIDGTKEFGSGKGEQCTICVGLASAQGDAVGGVVYRPLDLPVPTWAVGCASHGLARRSLRPSVAPPGFLCSAGRVSPFVQELAARMKLPMVPVGGAGNKVLMLLEGTGGAYIQDRGTSRWDTCGPQAVIEAHGGVLAQLRPFEARGELVRYTYRSSAAGGAPDFEPNLARITRYNAAPAARDQVGERAREPGQLQPHANTLGLLALPAAAAGAGLAACLEAVRAAASAHPPEYD